MPTKADFRVGLVQMRCSADPADNVKRALAHVKTAAKKGAEIVCLPELFRSQYFCQREDTSLFDLAEPIPGPTSDAFSKLAKKLGVAVVVSLFERRAPGVHHNTAVIIGPDGGTRGIYRKMHIPDDPAYYEKYYFVPGDLGFRVLDVGAAKVGTLVCWDQWFPEAARLTAMRGAEVLFYPTAIGWHPREKAEVGASQADAWRTIQRSHAIANGVWVCAVNRVGFEGSADAGLEFWGGSFVCDPFGVVVAEAGRTEEEVLVVRCDRARMEDVRRNWPFFRDRRIEAFGDITKRWIDGGSDGGSVGGTNG